MALYNYTALVGGSCGISDDYPSNQTCVTIRDCNRDVYGHLRAFSITNDEAVQTESNLLLARAGKSCLIYRFLQYQIFFIMNYIHSIHHWFAGIFRPMENHLTMTVCPGHRDLFGIRWRTTEKCAVPIGLAAHKSSSTSGTCGLTSSISMYIMETSNIIIPVGSRKYNVDLRAN